VYGISTDPIVLSGDGGVGIPSGVRWGVLGQADSRLDGIYDTGPSGWTRSADWAETETVLNGCRFEVTSTRETVTVDSVGDIIVGTSFVSFFVRDAIIGEPADEHRIVALDEDGRTRKSLARIASAIPSPGEVLKADVDGVYRPSASSAALIENVVGVTLPAQDKIKVRGADVTNDSANGNNTIDLARTTVAERGHCNGSTATTATGTTASAVVTLLAVIAAIKNGSYVMWAGSGPTHAMSAPGAPTAFVQGVAGATTYAIKCVAVTSTFGYTAASTAATVTTANATLTSDNFVEVWAAAVPGARWYAWFVQKNGTGNFDYAGCTIAYPMIDRVGYRMIATLRLTSNTYTKTAHRRLPSTAPASARANGARYKVISGAGTTSLTLDRAPATNATATPFELCGVVPWEDAMRSGSGEVLTPYGFDWNFTGDVTIDQTITSRGVNHGKEASGSWHKLQGGAQVRVDSNATAQQWQPKTLYRLGDRVQRTDPENGTNVVQELTSVLTPIAVGSVWGASGDTEPTWDEVAGHTNTDNGVRWTTRSGSATTALHTRLQGLAFSWAEQTVPAGRVCNYRSLRAAPEFFAKTSPFVNGVWTANTIVPAGSYGLPSAAKYTGKAYRTNAGGTTGTAEPATWGKVIGGSTADTTGGGTITDWVAVDMPIEQGAGLVSHVPITVDDVYIDSPGGSGWHIYGVSGLGSNVNHSKSNGLKVNNPTGAGLVIAGVDANVGLHIHPDFKNIGGYCAYQDSSNYGALCIMPQNNDSGACYQNNPASSVQFMALLLNLYQEGNTGDSLVDWYAPGEVWKGNAVNFTATSTASRRGLGADSADIGDFTWADLASTIEMRLRNNLFAIDYIAGTTAALTFSSILLSYNTSTKRWQFGLKTLSTQTPLELVQHGAFGKIAAFPNGLLLGQGGMLPSSYETRIGATATIPTVGAFQQNTRLIWVLSPGDQPIRKAIVATRRGVLGSLGARANLTSYAAGSIVFDAGMNRSFVMIADATKTSGSSEPATMATATLGQEIPDGGCVWQCFHTSIQDPGLRSEPNLDAPPVTMAATTAAINITDGSVQECPNTGTSYTKTIGTTGAYVGDRMSFAKTNLGAGVFTLTNGVWSYSSVASQEFFLIIEFDGSAWRKVPPWLGLA
jgi:hypothetical protein